jgi:Universal stress protein family
MLKRITVAYSESPESRRALASPIHLARILRRRIAGGNDRRTSAGLHGLCRRCRLFSCADNQHRSCGVMRAKRQSSEGVALQTHLLQGEKVGAIAGFLAHHKTDLLVIGLHHRQSHISRLWSSVYGLAQNAPCSVLGVH